MLNGSNPTTNTLERQLYKKDKKRLKIVNMTNGLEETIPSSIGCLPELNHFYISGSGLTGTLSEALSLLIKLTYPGLSRGEPVLYYKTMLKHEVIHLKLLGFGIELSLLSVR